MSLVAPLLGFATLLLGGFSRFGIWNQIFGAVVLVIVVYTLDNAMADLALERPGGWPFVYLAPLAGLVMTAAILWIAANPQIFRRRSNRGAAAG